MYDEKGDPFGFKYNDEYYVYIKNLQNDVMAIADKDRNIVVRYTYDSWGKLLKTEGTLANTIGKENPIRYRSYYYDTESGYYFLQSRYYDPDMCRFLNADGYVTTGQGVLSHNMFAYCANNPINRLDQSGHFWEEVCEFFSRAITEIGIAIGALSPTYAGCLAAAAVDGPLPIGDIVGCAVAIGASAVAVGYGVYQATQNLSISIPKVEEKEKTEVINPPKPSPIFVYRYGGSNPGNLTPKEKDRYSGLSFSTIPMPGAAMTTIDALNSTGIVYAIQDGATHVSVRPVGATMDDWINEGSSSIWTQAVKSVVIKWDGGY